MKTRPGPLNDCLASRCCKQIPSVPLFPPLIIAGALALGFCPGSGFAADGPAPAKPREVASQVRPIFARKCTECHGADLTRPQGRFGYVLDLERLAGNRKLVVPLQSAQSRLWQLIDDDEMPPAEGRAGPLTREEKETIRRWIDAGAPAAPSRPLPAPSLLPGPQEEGGAGSAPARPSGKRLLRWLGKFHVLVIHFPIALLMAAAIGELWWLWRGGRSPCSAVRFGVLLGAGGAVAAAVLGWLHADFGGYGAGLPQVLSLHRWVGTAAALWAAGTALVLEIDTHRQRRSRLFRFMLWAGALLVGAAGHFGGTLVHGAEFFDW